MNDSRLPDALEEAFEKARALVFDFDGVLADSEPVFRRSWNHALEPWGHTIEEEEYWKYWSSLGEGLDGEIERRGLAGIDRSEAAGRQKAAYEEMVSNGDVRLFPGAAELLSALSRRGSAGMPFCIASNTPSELIRSILQQNGVPVPLTVGGEGMRKKPAPDIFNKAAERIGCSPSDALVFEDSWKGITAAKAGGFVPVLILNARNRNLGIECGLEVDGTLRLKEILMSRTGQFGGRP